MGKDLLGVKRDSEPLLFADVKFSASSSFVRGSSSGSGIFPQLSAVSHSPSDIAAESHSEGIAPDGYSSINFSTLPSSLVAFLSKTELLINDIRNVPSRTIRKKRTGHEHSIQNKSIEISNRKILDDVNCKSTNNERSISGGGLPHISEDRGRLSRSSKAIHRDCHGTSSCRSLVGCRKKTGDFRNEFEEQHLEKVEWMTQKVNDKEHSTSSKEFSPVKNISKIDPQRRRLSKLCSDQISAPSECSKQLENIPQGHTTNEWQNELARYILSMYATTTATADSGGSEALLKFVDPNSRITMQTVSKDLFKKGGRRKSDVTQLTDNRMLISLEHNESMEKNNNCYAKIEKADGVGDGVSVGVGDNGKGMSVGMNINDNIARGTHSADDIREDSMKEVASVRERIPRTHSLQEIVKKHLTRIPRPPSMESVKVIRNHAPTIPNTSIPTSSSYSSSSRQRGQTAYRTERRWAGSTITGFSGGGSDVRAQDGQTYLRMRGPPSCFPVWFVGTGDVYSDWSKLLSGLEGVKLHAQLKCMYEHGEYREYLGVVESVLNRSFKELITAENSYPAYSTDETTATQIDGIDSIENAGSVGQALREERKMLTTLWLQLISSGVGMASLSVDAKKYDLALNLLQRCKEWSARDNILSARQCATCKAHVFDTFSYFFFRRKKYAAALHHAELSKLVHGKHNNHDGLASTLLRISAIQCQQGMFVEAHKTLYHFFSMLEDGRLQFHSASPTQLCQVAVSYHNLAVVQIKMQASDAACKTSQNARKIARLCLSVSTRYLASFQRTHDAALSDLKYHLEYRPVAAGYGEEAATYSTDKLTTVNNMIENYFHTSSDIDSAS